MSIIKTEETQRYKHLRDQLSTLAVARSLSLCIVGIIPDGLAQMRLSQFRKDFPNLKANLSSISSSTNSKIKQYSNINVGESDGGISTDQGRVATQRDLQLTNQEQILRSGGKRKVESQVLNCKKRRENTDFGGSKTDQTQYIYCNILSLYHNILTI